MNMFEQIKAKAFEDEMQKIAISQRAVAQSILNATKRNIVGANNKFQSNMAMNEAVDVGGILKRRIMHMNSTDQLRNSKNPFSKDHNLRGDVAEAIKVIKFRRGQIRSGSTGTLEALADVINSKNVR
jgi:hypothetical protein